MAQRLSKDSRRKISATLEREEEQKKAQRKAMDERELRILTRQARALREPKVRDTVTEKQAKVKTILLKEKENIVDNLKLVRSERQCVMDTKQAQDIANLFAQGDDLDAAIAQEKKYIEDIESQIHKDSKNLNQLKNKRGDTAVIGSEYLQQKENNRADRTLESWKSRLHAEQTHLSLVTKENEEMRNKLQRLLKEKSQFNKLYENLMGHVTRGKGIMADIVDQSRQLFQKREEVARKIEALKSRDKGDCSKRMEEMQELEMKLSEDKRLAVFRDRVLTMREKLMDTTHHSNKDTLEQRAVSERLGRAKDLWEQLKQITGLESAEEISKFITDEDYNLFRLYSFNMEIRDQLEALIHKTAEMVYSLNEEINTAEEVEEEHLKRKYSMEKRLTELEQKFNDLSDYYDTNARLFTRILEKVESLFDLVKGDRSPLLDLLGNNAEVTGHNYRLFLGLVESEIIAAMEILTKNTDSAHNRVISRLFFKSSKSERSKGLQSRGLLSKRILTQNCLECDGPCK